MLLLLRDVFAHRLARRCADGERPVALLPCKRTFTDFLMHPARRHRFYIAHHIREAGRRAKADEQMHMIRDTADGFWHAFDISHHAAEVCVQSFPPRGDDDRSAILRAKDDVIMEREMGGRHSCEVPAPLPGRVAFLPAIRWLTPPTNFGAALRASAPLDQLPKPDFLRAWCAVAYAFPGLHPDGYKDAGSGWSRVLKRFAAEAWRRADEELYPGDAQWAGLYDRMHAHEDDETARRFQIAADSGERADG